MPCGNDRPRHTRSTLEDPSDDSGCRRQQALLCFRNVVVGVPETLVEPGDDGDVERDECDVFRYSAK